MLSVTYHTRYQETIRQARLVARATNQDAYVVDRPDGPIVTDLLPIGRSCAIVSPLGGVRPVIIGGGVS